MDAPEYQPGDSVGDVYCNRDCQKEHLPKHKVYCRARRQRKKLLRAANILKAALLTYREVVYDLNLTKIELQNVKVMKESLFSVSRVPGDSSSK